MNTSPTGTPYATISRSSEHTVTISKTTSREIVFKLTQFREDLEKTAQEEGTDIFNLQLGVGYVLQDICESLGLDRGETRAVMGEATAETQEACYPDTNTSLKRQLLNDLTG
jgi:hypothetical protein